jgi:hypothetical protein
MTYHEEALGTVTLIRNQPADVFSSVRAETTKRPIQKIMPAISICLTQELGGQLDRCDRCGFKLHG